MATKTIYKITNPERLNIAARTIHRLSVNGKEGQKGRNKGVTVLFIPKNN
jgi:hypothetical protein